MLIGLMVPAGRSIGPAEEIPTPATGPSAAASLAARPRLSHLLTSSIVAPGPSGESGQLSRDVGAAVLSHAGGRRVMDVLALEALGSPLWMWLAFLALVLLLHQTLDRAQDL